jgi:hypothetical protein
MPLTLPQRSDHRTAPGKLDRATLNTIHDPSPDLASIDIPTDRQLFAHVIILTGKRPPTITTIPALGNLVLPTLDAFLATAITSQLQVSTAALARICAGLLGCIAFPALVAFPNRKR